MADHTALGRYGMLRIGQFGMVPRRLVHGDVAMQGTHFVLSKSIASALWHYNLVLNVMLHYRLIFRMSVTFFYFACSPIFPLSYILN